MSTDIELGETIDAIASLRDAMEAVPFGQSVFQNTFLADAAETPERRLRYVLLQLNQKMSALKECDFRRREAGIELRELRQKLGAVSGFEAEKIALAIERKEWALQSDVKLVKDALIEADTFYRIYKSLPEITREGFEAAELGYWVGRFIGEAKKEVLSCGSVSTGTLTALHQVGVSVTKNGDQIDFKVDVPRLSK